MQTLPEMSLGGCSLSSPAICSGEYPSRRLLSTCSPSFIFSSFSSFLLFVFLAFRLVIACAEEAVYGRCSPEFLVISRLMTEYSLPRRLAIHAFFFLMRRYISIFSRSEKVTLCMGISFWLKWLTYHPTPKRGNGFRIHPMLQHLTESVLFWYALLKPCIRCF